MSMTQINCGYLPLVDSAPLIIAKELTFAAQEGIDLHLDAQPSWSALRDRLAVGHVQFAHMLAPMPIAMSLGLGGLNARIDALMVLSINGTVIGVTAEMLANLKATGWIHSFQNPSATAQALLAATSKPIRIGVPFPFSMHRMLLEYWITQAKGFAPDRIEIVTIPPPKMADAVRDGQIDMFCVGEPWGTVAVQQSAASLILPGARIWAGAPEKILGARHDWVEDNPGICHALIRAIYKACKWLDQPSNKPLALEVLARSRHLDLPDHVIEPALTGQITRTLGQAPTPVDRFLRFHEHAATFPWRSQAKWIADRLSTWHSLEKETARTTAQHCFRTDHYRAALSSMGVDLPGASEKLEGALSTPTAMTSTRGQMILGPDNFFDGAVFDFAAKTLAKN